MKTCTLLILLTAVVGCNSSSNNTDNNGKSLLGSWLSNCHEFVGVEGLTGDPIYSISEITFTETGYVDRYVSYTDINCTADTVEEANSIFYTLGDMVSTTDGVSATRMTITPIIPDRPELSMPFDAIFRISGVDLNFGEFIEGATPTIDYRVTYTKQ